jgi:hypothetical protein
MSALLITVLSSGILQAQERTTVNVKDLPSGVEKYIEKNYKDFKTNEAYKFNLFYEIVVQNQNTKESLLFNRENTFVRKKTEADKTKIPMQMRSTLSVDEVESDITKYVKKNMEGFKVVEAYRYNEVYGTKIMKGTETHTLLFDKEGAFVRIVPPPPPAAPAAPKAPKPDSMPVPPPPVMPDTTK